MSKMYTQIGVNGDAKGALGDLAAIDKEIEGLNSKKRSLNINDTSGRAKVQAEIDEKLKQREPLADVVGKLSAANQQDISKIEGALKALDELASTGGITQENYSKETAQLKETLNAANKAQEQFGKLMKANVDAISLLALEFAKIGAVLKDTTTGIDVDTSDKSSSNFSVSINRLY